MFCIRSNSSNSSLVKTEQEHLYCILMRFIIFSSYLSFGEKKVSCQLTMIKNLSLPHMNDVEMSLLFLVIVENSTLKTW